jgi:hypothetical protein
MVSSIIEIEQIFYEFTATTNYYLYIYEEVTTKNKQKTQKKYNILK